MQHLPAFEYQRVRWRNELGWTREIAVEHEANDQLLWRVSVAEIDHDGAFSDFSGLQRDQILLSGGGFRLGFADSPTLSAEPPHGRVSYPGSPAPECRLIDGPARAFNLFHDPTRVCARLLHRPLVGTMMVFCQPGQRWLIHLLGGHLAVQRDGVSVRLEQGDSLLLGAHGDSPAASQRTLLEGGGELLMISLTDPRPATADPTAL